MKMSNKTYDILKVISMIAVDVAAFIVLFAEELGFGWGPTVAKIITAAGFLLGTILIKSSKDYRDKHDPHGEPIEDKQDE